MPTGVIIIDKPPDWTSMDVCAKLRGTFREKRIGHAGTLDPMATGVLPVFIGRATKAVPFAETGEKEYVAALRFGLTTNTQDISGEPLQTSEIRPTREEVLTILPRFQGNIDQIPPMYSAIKIHGKKLYELARKGVEVDRPPRHVTIHALTLLNEPSPQGDFLLKIRCSKGVYIRTLCHDIGQALGCGGCMASLRRTEACGFTLADAHPLQSVITSQNPTALLKPVDQVFQSRPTLTVTARGEDRLRHGSAIPIPQTPDGTYRVYGPRQNFLLLGQIQSGRLTSIKNFFEV